jgi:hypothetical protein
MEPVLQCPSTRERDPRGQYMARSAITAWSAFKKVETSLPGTTSATFKVKRDCGPTL